MARDPFKYFRIEAPEILDGMEKAALELGRGEANTDLVTTVLRLAHTLKGAARVVNHAGVAELAHAFEEVLIPYRGRADPVAREAAEKLLRLCDEMKEKVAALGTPNAPATTAPPAPAKDAATVAPSPANRPATPRPAEVAPRFDTVRVEIDDMNRLLERVSELGARMSALHHQIGTLGNAELSASNLAEEIAGWRNSPQALDSGSEPLLASCEQLRASLGRLRLACGDAVGHAQIELDDVRATLATLRLIPVQSVFQSLERAVADAAATLGRTVRFEASGGETRLDGHILGPLRDALLHVVRNAVAHGIEPEAERTAAGKPKTGVVRVDVERRGGRVVFRCQDDGRGFDLAAIRQGAVRAGLSSADAAERMDLDASLDLLADGKFSTAGEVTEIAGRGIGVSIVRDTVNRLRGTVHVASTAGRGATVELSVPVSLATMPAVLAEVEQVACALPMDCVRGAARLRQEEITHSQSGDSVFREGRLMRFVPLASGLRRGAPVEARSSWTALFVECDNSWVSVGVDRVIGVSEIVVHSLPPLIGDGGLVSGCTFDGNGDPQLVLDPRQVAALASGGVRRMLQASVETTPPILAIDDSLTTRMLVQGILEAAGYEVDLAASGEEGLAKAKSRRYGVIIVDVEMPGMNGFEFIERSKADPDLSEIPAILVTSLASPEHKRRGMQVGAHAYIVKGEFEQGRFLDTVRRLVG